MSNSSKSSTINLLPKIVLLGVGLLVFLGVFFADKTSLSSDDLKEVKSEREKVLKVFEGSPSSLEKKLAPLSDPQIRDSILTLLQNEENEDQRKDHWKFLVGTLQQQKRLDWAAVYAGKYAEEYPESKNYTVAAALYREATKNVSSSDSSLKGAFNKLALEKLDKALVIDPKNEDALIEKGLALIESGIPENSMQGIRSLLEVLKINPDNEEAGLRLGLFSIQTGQFEKAENRFVKVIDNNPDNFTAKYYLAKLYLENLGEKAEAVSLLNELKQQSVSPSIAEEARLLLSKL